MNDEPDDFDSNDFEESSDDGLSLDELSGSLANLLGQSTDAAQPNDQQVESPSESEAALQVVGDESSVDGGQTSPAAESKSIVSDDGCPVTPATILEAMLFVGHPEDIALTSKTVASLMRGVREVEVDQLVAELNEAYESESCPYQIETSGGGHKLVLRDEFNAVRERFYGKIREAKLSQAAIDVLALVAYQQPIDRERVERLRAGEPSGRILNQLVRRELVAVQRTEEKPRRNLFTTTDRFLLLFGLDSLDELPQSQDFDRR